MHAVSNFSKYNENKTKEKLPSLGYYSHSTKEIINNTDPPPVWLVCGGVGAQWAGMLDPLLKHPLGQVRLQVPDLNSQIKSKVIYIFNLIIIITTPFLQGFCQDVIILIFSICYYGTIIFISCKQITPNVRA